MAQGSFENQEIAKELNEHFINIKVDRQERPDIDEIYQKAVMLYDNAQLVKLYVDAYRLIGKLSWKNIFTETIEYVLREVTNTADLLHQCGLT